MLFFFTAPAPTEIYTLSLHDALPISAVRQGQHARAGVRDHEPQLPLRRGDPERRSEEHTSELQSLTNLVCRLLLEKKNSSRRARKETLSRHRRDAKERIIQAIQACNA